MGVSLGKAKSVLSETFISECADITEDRAMEAIIKAEIEIKALEEERENDDSLNAAKNVAKDLNAGYSSAIKHNKAKIKFLIEKIEAIREGISPNASV